MRTPNVSTPMALINVNADEATRAMGGNVKRLVSKHVTKVDVPIIRIISAFVILDGLVMIVQSIVDAIIIRHVEWELENVTSVKITLREITAKDVSLEVMEMRQTQLVVCRAIAMVTVTQ
jgi:hypothetical protein